MVPVVYFIMYAVVSFTGEQFCIRDKSKIFIKGAIGTVGDVIQPNHVHLNLTGGLVSASVIAHTVERGVAYKKRRRHGYEKTIGYRVPRTLLQVSIAKSVSA